MLEPSHPLRSSSPLLKKEITNMRQSTRIIAIVGATAVLFSAMTLPASAATSGGTPVTTAVTGGVLSITVPTASVPLGAAIPGASTPSTALGNIVVSDTRAGKLGWVATALVGNLTSSTVTSSGAIFATIPAANVAYTATTAAVTGTATVTATSPASIAAAAAVQTATAVKGNNTATWNPTIVVTMPADALAAADYVATITHSVA